MDMDNSVVIADGSGGTWGFNGKGKDIIIF